MVIATKVQCKNNEDYLFSGKEMSPLGLGYCAESESVGEQMNGRDGKSWVVSVKNGEKAWVRSPEKIGLEKDEPLATKKKTIPVEETPIPESPKNKDPKAIDFEEGYEYTNEDNITFVVKTVKNLKKWVKKTEPKTKTKTKTKRGPTKYNLFIGRTLDQLRQDVKGLKTVEYMKMALAIWNNLTKEEKANLA
jgi:hypothetical protein